MKKTIAGVGDVDFTPDEIEARQAEEQAWEVIKNEPKPMPIELRLQVLEAKVGITDIDLENAKLTANEARK